MAAYESLIAFWRDAGVDACYLDEPVDHTKIQPIQTPAVVQKLASVAPMRGPRGTTHASQGGLEARQLAAQANDLPALIETVATFEGCGLKHMGAKNALFGMGNADADLLVIADAPSGFADAANQPFASPEGRLLERILKSVNVQDRSYLAYTVFWTPPGGRMPTPEEQAVCLPFIERAVELIKPKAVLLLGATAVRGVLNSTDSIVKINGQWQDWTLQDGTIIPAMPIFTPGFLMQTPAAKRSVWQAMLKLAERI